MTKTQILERLRNQTEAAGGIRAWSRANDFSASFISDVLTGKVPPSTKLLALLGYEAVRQVKYRALPKSPPAEDEPVAA